MANTIGLEDSRDFKFELFFVIYFCLCLKVAYQNTARRRGIALIKPPGNRCAFRGGRGVYTTFTPPDHHFRGKNADNLVETPETAPISPKRFVPSSRPQPFEHRNQRWLQKKYRDQRAASAPSPFPFLWHKYIPAYLH